MAPLPTEALVDREIMLTCLADAAETAGAADFAAGKPARRLLELRRRTTATRREAADVCQRARAQRGDCAPAGALDPNLIYSGLGMGLMILDLRRADLHVGRALAAELRSDARALRAEARQIRVRFGPPFG
jgi:hypothetical protein